MKLEDINSKILGGLSGKAKEDFERGLANLNIGNPADRAALRKAIKRYRPDYSEAQLDIAVSGEAPPDKQEWI